VKNTSEAKTKLEMLAAYRKESGGKDSERNIQSKDSTTSKCIVCIHPWMRDNGYD